MGRPMRKDGIGMKLTMPRSWSCATKLSLIIAVSIVALAALMLAPRVPLGPHYHDFADRRTVFAIPNGQDVLSNIPFVVVGVWGFVWLLGEPSKLTFVDQRERVPYQLFFIGTALTGIGSFWYHLAPSNYRLPWDLVPMTCAFMSIVVAMFMERVSVRIGLLALLPLILLGAASVAFWYFSETRGHGEYKFYLFVQFFSPVVCALIIGLFPPRYSGMRYLVLGFCLFVVAKICESFDQQIYSSTRFVSGHALKHVIAGVACYWILRMLQARRPVVPKQSSARHSPRQVDAGATYPAVR
jgi:hypothetical protein